MRGRYLLSCRGKDKLVPVASSRDRAPTLFDSRPRRVAGVRPSERHLLLFAVTAQLATLLQDALGPAYRLERGLEAGGMSRLFLATDVKLSRQVVVKVLPPDLVSTASIARFKREIELTVRLQHPHILPILTSGEWGDGLYYIAPYIPGESLRARIEREGKLPLDEVLKILKDISGALAFAHQRGIAHRDIKPGNILLADGHAILADFGIARAVSTTATPLTESGVAPGTPAYMAPELPTDERADVYSLGIVAYEMLCGHLPSEAVTLGLVLRHRGRVEHDSRLRLRRVAQLIAETLRRSAAERLSSARVLNVRVESLESLGRSWAVLGGLAVAAVTVVAAAFVWKGDARARAAEASGLDTTRVIVFPFDASTVGEATASQEQMSRALSRWRGIHVADAFEVSEAFRAQRPTDDAGLRRVARRLSVGRYIRGRVISSPTDSSRSVHASLYDVGLGRLAEATALVGDQQGAAKAYTALADSLLLRGTTFEIANTGGERNLPAAQLMARGMRALNNWELDSADAAFAEAAAIDASARRPLLWDAQVRQWAGKPSDAWLPEVRASVADSTSLMRSERWLADALLAIGNQDFPAACLVYGSMIGADSSSFAGWYGLGECHVRDKIVVRDPRSRTGWRFRASYHQGLLAYTRAFELLPATYRGFRGNAYARLRSLLPLTARELLTGKTQTQPPQTMWARVALIHDTIVAVPAPMTVFASGQSPVDLADNARAIVYLRRLFSRIARTWGIAFPQSADAKEAVAVSLELQGDASAVDSLAAVERLTVDASSRLRVAAAKILAKIKFAIPEDTANLMSARASAESLLVANDHPPPADARFLAPVAAVLGQCSVAARFLRRGAVPIPGPVEIPASVAGDIYARVSYVALQCPMAGDAPTIGQIAGRIEALGPKDLADAAEAGVLPLIIALSDDAPPEWTNRFGGAGDYILAARAQMLRGERDSARARLARVDATRRSAFAGDVTPDAVLPEALLYLQMRDTLSAVRALDEMLLQARHHAPVAADEPWYAAVWVGTLIRSMDLRARLPATPGSDPKVWARAVAKLRPPPASRP